MLRIIASGTSLLCLFAALTASAQTDPTRIPALYSKVYVPGGFDSNDHVQFLGEGTFRNTCYRHAETSVRVELDQRRIVLDPVAYEYAGFCLQVILPFERVLDVGLLKAGTWTIVQGPNFEKLGQINIRAASREDADDYLYAPISQAFFRQRGIVKEVVLTGDFTNDCLSVDQVRVTVEPDVIVLQPIAKIEPRTNCHSGRYPFVHTVVLPAATTGRYLLHVRAMNGHAVNSLIGIN